MYRGEFPEKRPPEFFEGSVLILDANALISPFQFSFNLDLKLEERVPEATVVVPTSVIKELEGLAKSGDWKAKAALELSKNYHWVVSKGRGDRSIYNLAVENDWMVMTQDIGLRNKLLKSSIPVVFLRGKGNLSLMEP